MQLDIWRGVRWAFVPLALVAALTMVLPDPIIAALVALIGYLGWRWWIGGSEFHGGSLRNQRIGDRAYGILRERFASGEISEEEFKAQRRTLFE